MILFFLWLNFQPGEARKDQFKPLLAMSNLSKSRQLHYITHVHVAYMHPGNEAHVISGNFPKLARSLLENGAI